MFLGVTSVRSGPLSNRLHKSWPNGCNHTMDSGISERHRQYFRFVTVLQEIVRQITISVVQNQVTIGGKKFG